MTQPTKLIMVRVLATLTVLSLLLGIWLYFLIDTPFQVVLPLKTISGALALASVIFVAVMWILGTRSGVYILSIPTFGLLIVLASAYYYQPECNDFALENAGIPIAGTVCRPARSTEKKNPIAILVHGSGRESRDEYQYYAENLAYNGVVGVVYDKRGTGLSGGDTYSGGYDAYASDLVRVTDFVRSRSACSVDTIGYVGFSEAEWVIPLASRVSFPNFIVLVGASGLSPIDQVQEEIELRLRDRGFGEEAVESAISVHRMFGSYLRGEVGKDPLISMIEQGKRENWFEAAADLPEVDALDADHSWWTSVMDTDPAVLWKGIDAPVMLLKGGHDDRSDPTLSMERLDNLLGRNDDTLSKHVFEAGDHMLLVWKSTMGVRYPTFPVNYPELIATWIKSVDRDFSVDRRPGC